MLNKVFLDNDGVINILVVGDQTAESVREMGEKLEFFTRQRRAEGRPVLVLDNLLHMGATDSDARREVGRIARRFDCDRAVMVGGGSLMMRYSTNLMLRAIGRANLRYFAAEESARRWLLGQAASNQPL